MSNPELLDQLRNGLRDAGLFPPVERTPYLRALIRQRGEVEQSWLRAEVGREIWMEGVKRLATQNPEASVIRICGYGALLTEFLIAPLKLPESHRSQAARLGARANLIVSLYDNLLDQGYAAPDLLPDYSGGDSIVPLLPLLVRGYFTQLPAAPRRSLLERAIQRMYEAEHRVTSGGFTASIWRRKSALPWVVMGLGGWVLGSRGDWPHLMWMFRVGCFLGWIDDAADLELDLTKGRPNRLAYSGPDVIRYIVDLGTQVMDWWKMRSSPENSSDAFRYCVNSWIASPPG